MSGASWTHILARQAVTPLVGTGVTPNHITTLRLLTGLAACVAVALGSRSGAIWGGVFWVLSAFLDRADGELARIGRMSSPGGHLYDYVVDSAVNALFFAAIGIGLRHSWLGGWALALGGLTCVAMLLASWWAELYEQRTSSGGKSWTGAWGFDVDDALYLLGPFAWLGWLAPVLVLSAIGTSIMAALTGLKLLTQRRARAALPASRA